MSLLQSHEKSDRVAEFDPSSGKLEEFSRSKDLQRASQDPVGSYGKVGTKTVILYREGGNLLLRIDGRDFDLAQHTVRITRIGSTRRVRLLRCLSTVSEWEYQVPVLEPPLSHDPTPFIEEEDFDYGLFLENISRDIARQSRLYSGPKGTVYGSG